MSNVLSETVAGGDVYAEVTCLRDGAAFYVNAHTPGSYTQLRFERDEFRRLMEAGARLLSQTADSLVEAVEKARADG